MRHMGLRHAAGWRCPGARRHAERYFLGAPDTACMDPQQAALDHAVGGRSGVRDTARRLNAGGEQWPHIRSVMEDEGFVDDGFIEETAWEYVGLHGDRCVRVLRQLAEAAEQSG